MAERLARDGFDVLRFDYFGTGDSSGDDAEGDLSVWTEDVLRADDELRARSGAPRCTWFGLRLGGTLAALAAPQAKVPPHRLVLWDPVVDGAAYLDGLAQSHRAIRRLDFGPRWAVEGRLRDTVVREAQSECLGFPITPSLKHKLGALSGGAFRPSTARVCIFQERRSSEMAVWARSLGPTASVCAIDTGVDWASNEAMNSAIVPAAALNRVLEAFAEEGA